MKCCNHTRALTHNQFPSPRRGEGGRRPDEVRFSGCPFRFLDQRASAALRAAALRCAGVIFAASAGPPLSPPSRPSATAAGFFVLFDISGAWHASRRTRSQIPSAAPRRPNASRQVSWQKPKSRQRPHGSLAAPHLFPKDIVAAPKIGHQFSVDHTHRINLTLSFWFSSVRAMCGWPLDRPGKRCLL